MKNEGEIIVSLYLGQSCIMPLHIGLFFTNVLFHADCVLAKEERKMDGFRTTSFNPAVSVSLFTCQKQTKSRRKKLRITACVLIVLMAFSVFPPESVQAGQYNYTLEAGSYEIVDRDGGYQEIHMEGFGQLLDSGKPKLPSRIFNIAIPSGMKVNSVNVIRKKPVVLKGTYNIIPAPMVLSTSNSEKRIAEIKTEYEKTRKAAYAGDSEYPVQIGHFVSQGAYRKYNLAQVRYSPFSYKPKSGKLLFYPSIEVRITYKGSQKLIDEAARTAGDSAASTETYARKIIVNYDEFQQAQAVTDDSAMIMNSKSNGTSYGFVIVTTNALEDRVYSIEALERAKGFEVYTVTVEFIDTYSCGVDLAEKIRNYLRGHRVPWNIEYVMLVGHMNDVPMRYTYPRGPDGYDNNEIPWQLSDTVPTDFYYAELSLPDEDSWRSGGVTDPCGNFVYGQQNLDTVPSPDSVQFPAEVAVGRIPISGPATVEYICNKIFEYGMNSDSSYKLNYLMAAAFLDEDTDSAVLMEYIIDHELDPCDPPVRIYEQDPCCWDSDCTSEHDMSQTITREVWGNEGPFGYVTLHGHGGLTGVYYKEKHDTCASEAFFSSNRHPDPSDPLFLDDNYPSVVFSMGCNTSRPDKEDSSWNMPTQLLMSGAVAYIGYTCSGNYHSGWTEPSDGSGHSMEYWFSHYAISQQEGRDTIGWSHQYALDDMHIKYGYHWHNIFGCTLHGNPSTWLLTPTALEDWLPDLTYTTPGGWDYPIVARSSDDAELSDCTVTPTLPGGTSDTCFNIAWTNSGDTDAAFHQVKAYIDDEHLFAVSRSLDSGAISSVLNRHFPVTISGGRHTIWYRIDEEQNVLESNELNNIWGTQFVWSPLDLNNDFWTRGAPPNPYRIDGGPFPCDGYEFQVWEEYPNLDEIWSVVAVMPDENAYYEFKLWDSGTYSGSQGGFGNEGILEQTSLGTVNKCDFFVLNGRHLPLGATYYAGVLGNIDDDCGYIIQEAVSERIYPYGNPLFGIGEDDIVDIYECNLQMAGDYRFDFEPASYGCDLGFALYHADTTYCGKMDYIPGTYVHSTNGNDVSFEVTIAEPGSYALVVWVTDPATNGTWTNYSIQYDLCMTPEFPSNPSPPDYATNQFPVQVLQWDHCLGAYQYEVFFMTEGESNHHSLGTTQECQWDLGLLDYDTWYGWYVVAHNYCGDSAGDFLSWEFTTRQQPEFDLTLIRPNGGEIGIVGEPIYKNIRWTSNLGGNIKIILLSNGTSEIIESSTPNDGSYEWTVTGPPSTDARVQISALPSLIFSDTSDADFTIIASSVEITAPNGGETLFTGEPFDITWNPIGGLSQQVGIKFSDDNGSSWENITRTDNDGLYAWTPTVAGDQYLIQITRDDNPGIQDVSDAPFTVMERSILLTAPNGQEKWRVGTSQAIEWKTYNLTGNLKIEISSDAGANWTTLASSTSDDGIFMWQVDENFVSIEQCLIKVSSLDFPGITDTSDQLFSIYVCPLICDLTGDCCVNIEDLDIFISQWLHYGNPLFCQYSADFVGNDCEITLEDFAMLASEWLECEG